MAARGILAIEFRRLLPAFAADRPIGKDAARALPAELLTARALTSAGLAALILLPVLMLASLALRAPLAGPAAIALGYLAMAHAIAFRRPRRAAVLSLTVLAGFVAWTLLFFLVGDGALSWSGLIAVSLAPVFAAAPALARRLAAPKADPAREAAAADIACLDRLAPSEAVLFLDGKGALLAATQAGLSALGLSAEAFGSDVTRAFQLLDRAMLMQGIERCRADGKPVEMALRLGDDGKPSIAAMLASTSRGRVTMRVGVISAGPAPVESEPDKAAVVNPEPGAPSDPGCDIQEAIAFAARHGEALARAKRVRISCDADAPIPTASDRRVSRLVIANLVDQAISCCRTEGRITIAARATKGVALVRISFDADPDDPGLPERLRRALDRSATGRVDDAGGSLLVEPPDAAGVAAIRLALPAAAAADDQRRRA